MNLNLFSNIINNYRFVRADFLGISFNLPGILNALIYLLFSIGIIAVIFLLGNKIRLLLFKEYSGSLKHLIDIGLGYIFFTSGIAILGMLSLLYPHIILIYFFLITLIGIYPIHNLKQNVDKFVELLKNIYKEYAHSKWISISIFLFILIAFLRLIPPEIGEDAISHHTSLPSLYLKSHSIMVNPKLSSSIVLPVPQLGEMLYVLTQVFVVKDASRYIHFVFYVLLLILIYYIGKNNRFGASLSILLFVTAPVVIQVSSRANVDFQWLFCWLLSVILITNEKISVKMIILSAVLLGGVLATKIWAIAFLPVFIIYLMLVIKNKKCGIKMCMIFILFSLLIPSFWYCRAYILTGSPFYPVSLSLFSRNFGSGVSAYIGFNRSMFNYENVLSFSPVALLGIAFLLFNKSNISRKIIRSRIFLFFALLFVEYLFMRPYFYPRYLLGLYVIFVVIMSSGMSEPLIKSAVNKNILIVIYVVLFSYYFINTLLILPYGFGWADSSKYLTRLLSRDNSSYYNFDHLFNKWISDKDIVATYGIYGYYYASFKYIDVSYVFGNDNQSFDLLLQKNITKLFINGGDIVWFCKRLGLNNCSLSRVKLLGSYPEGFGKYNLYSLK